MTNVVDMKPANDQPAARRIDPLQELSSKVDAAVAAELGNLRLTIIRQREILSAQNAQLTRQAEHINGLEATIAETKKDLAEIRENFAKLQKMIADEKADAGGEDPGDEASTPTIN